MEGPGWKVGGRSLTIMMLREEGPNAIESVESLFDPM